MVHGLAMSWPQSQEGEQTDHYRLKVCYSTVHSHVVLGLPAGHFQSFGGPYVSEFSARAQSVEGSALAR